MNNLFIEFPEEADAAAVVQVLREISDTIDNDTGELEDRERMDGSYPIDTKHGQASITPNIEL